jgi:hypothetical protein
LLEPIPYSPFIYDVDFAYIGVEMENALLFEIVFDETVLSLSL